MWTFVRWTGSELVVVRVLGRTPVPGLSTEVGGQWNYQPWADVLQGHRMLGCHIGTAVRMPCARLS